MCLLLLLLAPWSLTSPNLDDGGAGRSKNGKAAGTSECCNQTEPGHRVEVQFSSKVVQNEYIVTFDGYYSAEDREEHIKRALNGSNGRVSICNFDY